MFDIVNRLLGHIEVEEKGNLITIRGLPAGRLMADIRKQWSTGKIETFMFSHLTSSRLSFQKFFALDFVFAMETLAGNKRNNVNKRALNQIIQLMYQNTWLSNIKKDHPDIINREKLKKLTVTLLPQQTEFIELFNKMGPRYLLGGYMLAVPPGGGKTIGGLAMANVLEADTIICVIPKNSLKEVWEKTISEVYKIPESFWSSAYNDPLVIGRRHYIVHYEAMTGFLEFAKKNPKAFGKVVVLLDESHNLNELSAQRTNIFVELCHVVKASYVFWSSGTPLKAMGKEVAPLLMTIDPFFNSDTQERFMGVFGKSASRALDILANRMGIVSYMIEKSTIVDNKKIEENIDITIPNGKKYTLDAVRTEMSSFIEKRSVYYKQNMRRFEDIYKHALEVFESKAKRDAQLMMAYRQYQSQFKLVRSLTNAFSITPEISEAIKACNKFEKEHIAPTLDRDLKVAFLDARSVVKYVQLKIQGEALGRILGKLRAQCHVDMVEHVDWEMLIDGSEHKVVVFTSYVEVLQAVEKKTKELGYKPLVVYGETNKDLSNIINQFRDDIDANPLIATYKSLSSAVPLVMANTEVLLNNPFRFYERDQAISRVDRIGQTAQVRIFTTLLNTGGEPNISTRSDDILAWSKAQVEQIMGVKVGELSLEHLLDMTDYNEIKRETTGPSWRSW